MNALPFWVYKLMSEYHMAKMFGCMDSEWVPEWSRYAPSHLYNTKRNYYWNEQ